MNRPDFKALIYFLVRFKRLYGSILVLILFSSLAETFSLAAFLPLFSSVLDNNQVGTGFIHDSINSVAGLLPFADPLVAAAVLLMAAFSLKTLLVLMREGMNAFARARVQYLIKKQIIERYGDAEYQFFLENRQGDLIYNCVSTSISVGRSLLGVSQLVAHVLKIVAMGALVVWVFPMAAPIMAALGLTYYVLMFQITRRVSFRLGNEQVEALAEQNVIANEFFTGIHPIIAAGSTQQWVNRFNIQNLILSKVAAKEQMWLAAPRPLMDFVGVVFIMGIVLVMYAANPVGLGNSLAKLGIFVVSMIQILPSLNAIGRSWMVTMSALPAVEHAYQAINGPVPTRIEGDKILESFQQAIVFEDVSFAHQGRDSLLNNVNLTFEKGKVTAIVGRSGGGKTTIINMILGLFSPSSGRITIDGVPIQELQHEPWLRKIGFVSQEPFAFHTTVKENILFRRGDHSEEDVVKAAKVARAHEFISELPQQYDSVIGDLGMTLSGGQQQRMAIARAVLNSPEILIFDEATSSLDSVSERQVQDAIDSVSKNRTVIIVAHRLSTVRHADKIIVLENGEVLEQGTHEELISKKGAFSQMVAASS